MSYMKRFSAGLLGILCALGIGGATQATLILEYSFNETGTTAPSTGTDTTLVTMWNAAGAATDLHSASGTGVSGRPGDRAFDNTASTGMGSGFDGGRADTASALASLNDLTSETVAFWYNAQAAFNSTGARLITKGDTALCIADQYSANTLRFNYADSGSSAVFTELNTWVFFAATWDGANVTYYKGGINSPVTLLNTTSMTTPVNGTDKFTLGNYPEATYQRPFDGLLDNVRIYGATSGTSGALSVSQLEDLRLNDVMIPEPSTILLLACGGGLLLRRRRARR